MVGMVLSQVVVLERPVKLLCVGFALLSALIQVFVVDSTWKTGFAWASIIFAGAAFVLEMAKMLLEWFYDPERFSRDIKVDKIEGTVHLDDDSDVPWYRVYVTIANKSPVDADASITGIEYGKAQNLTAPFDRRDQAVKWNHPIRIEGRLTYGSEGGEAAETRLYFADQEQVELDCLLWLRAKTKASREVSFFVGAKGTFKKGKGKF